MLANRDEFITGEKWQEGREGRRMNLIFIIIIIILSFKAAIEEEEGKAEKKRRRRRRIKVFVINEEEEETESFYFVCLCGWLFFQTVIFSENRQNSMCVSKRQIKQQQLGEFAVRVPTSSQFILEELSSRSRYTRPPSYYHDRQYIFHDIWGRVIGYRRLRESE